VSAEPSSDRRPAPGPAGARVPVAVDVPAAVDLPAEVTFANASEVLERSLPVLDAALVRFDVSACRHFDSSLIGVMLELSRRASAAGRACAFTGASSNLRKLAGLYGVDALLFGEDTERDAEAVRSGA